MRSVSSLLFLGFFVVSAAAGEPAAIEPEIHVYATRGETELSAHVFKPEKQATSRSAIVILHGGGWSIGDPTWGYGPARRFAALGMVAISGQYRL